MRAVPLPLRSGDGGIREVSELGFGCAPLLGRAGRKDSLRALGAALDNGITLFDTARSYGYGAGEALLGGFLAEPHRRQEVAICTKFGILTAGRGGWRQRVKPLARIAVRAFPKLRRAAQRQAGTQFVAGQFSVAVLRDSLAASLRALRTDYVDLLLLHAAPPSALAQDDLLESLGRLLDEGTVRVAGISGELDVIAETFQRRSAGGLASLRTAQFALDPSRLAFVRQTRAERTGMLLVANHPFAGPAGAAATARAVQRLRSSNTVSGELAAKLDDDPRALVPEIILNGILRGTGVHAVVPAMVRPASLRGNVRALEHCRFSEEELETLRQALILESAAAAPSASA